MAKKIYLDSRAEAAYFSLIGISCHLKDYRLSYLLNQKLEFSFKKLDDLVVFPAAGKEPAEFSFYYYKDDDRFNTYSLVANRSQDSILIPHLKQTDFLLVVEGEFKKTQKDPVLNLIRTIPNVLTAFEIKTTEIKNLESLLTDIEMHLMKVTKEIKQKFPLRVKS